MSERKPFTVDDSGAWLGSQLERPAESASLTPPTDVDGDSGTADPNATNRPSGGAAYLVVMVAVAVLGSSVLFWLWTAGGGR